MNPAINQMASYVASHTCAFKTLFIKQPGNKKEIKTLQKDH